MMPLSYADVRPHDGLVTTAGFFRVIGHDRTGDKQWNARRRRQARRRTRVQSQGPRTGHTTLLLIDTDDSQQLTAQCNRRWIRLATQLLASSLDHKLAQGRSPESSRLLAARAQVLVSPVSRRKLVDNWENLLVQVRRPPAMRNPRVLCNREYIIACESDIREMLNALLAPLPSPARGTAMASWLLRDGTGPIYNRGLSEDLGNSLREVIAQLDPAVSL